jgi:hypothetical protein
MEVDLHLLTNAKGKRTKQVSQLDEYFDSLLFDYTSGSKTKLLLLNSDNPCPWWLQVGCERYPILFNIAGDYLSIPSTSCKCKRPFSKARQTMQRRSQQAWRHYNRSYATKKELAKARRCEELTQ